MSPIPSSGLPSIAQGPVISLVYSILSEHLSVRLRLQWAEGIESSLRQKSDPGRRCVTMPLETTHAMLVKASKLEKRNRHSWDSTITIHDIQIASTSYHPVLISVA